MSNTRKIRRPRLPLLAPGVHIVEIRHDDGCPTLRTRQMEDCTCKMVQTIVTSPSVRQN